MSSTENYPRYQGRSKDPYKRKGINRIVYGILDPFIKLYYKLFRKFTYDGETYSYFYHYYNTTYRNERTIEVPIGERFLERFAGKKIFEFGDVLSRYFKTNHLILDKYEIGDGIINEDIVGYPTIEKFDLVISISTLEHVGRDEVPQDFPKVITALQTLRDLKKEDGTLFITFALGYNKFLDELIFSGKEKFKKIIYMQRISEDNRWVECSKEVAMQAEYAKPFRNGNVVAFLYD